MLNQNSKKKIVAFLIIFTIGTTALQINQFFGNVYAQSNLWYVGKGVKPDSYYTYQIQNADVNQGQPFTMTLYFKDYNATGKYWVVPTYVVNNGQVLNGTLHLSDLDMTALGSSNVSSDFAPYRGGYATSLDWLSAFVPKPGQSLTSAYWGKIAAIGGNQIAPGGTAKVTTPAGTFDTTVITWHKGVDNNIYINANMPFPVKAQTYADVTTGNPPIQYAYTLQAAGTGQPPIPKSQIEIPKPPLTLGTETGAYTIQLLWEPTVIKAGQDTKFGLVITDSSGQPALNSVYSLQISDKNDKVIGNVDNQNARDGTGQSTFKFPTAGPYHIKVTVQSASTVGSDLFVETATFTVVAS
jgi:hypothetical protein